MRFVVKEKGKKNVLLYYTTYKSGVFFIYYFIFS